MPPFVSNNSESKSSDLSLNILNAPHLLPCRAVDGIPAEVSGTVFCRPAAAGQIFGVLFMDILPGLVAMVAGSHQPLTHRRVNLQIDRLIRRRQAQQVVFIVKEPLQECVPLLRRELRALMHGIEVV